ncbi:sigma-70 family RNA polymerase sigma factor [Clostridium sp. BJN0001]|uniref:sigma-70 family RNA polymerase sigma factor n=1 Tax=Clostridium sp. BJN0001 TaxID=2930219 RepID=UPI001FD5337E|nr:sigma-70 family RNA polymerase sigma factor [Clostridium sp. BJN0001]
MNYNEIESIVKRIKNGDNDAKIDLMMQFEKNIICIISKMHIHGYDFDDLKNECYSALFHAVKLYDPKKHRFVSYATNAIRNQVYNIGRFNVSKKFRNDDTGILFTPSIETMLTSEIDLENDFIKRLSIKKIHKIIFSLTKEEREMVYILFFENNTLKQYASHKNIPYSAAFYKKNQLFKKIRRLFSLSCDII